MLIITRDEAIERLNKLVVVPSTGKIWGIPSEGEVGREDGMPEDGVLSLDNTSLVRKSMLTELITTLDPAKMDAVCKALVAATSCG